MKKFMLRAIRSEEENMPKTNENENKEVSTEETKKSTRRKKKEEND